MRGSVVLFATLVVLTALPLQAQAQRSNRGSVNTPYGSFSMSEMRAAGGNPIVAGQIREQKQLLIAQQQLLKQQQQML